MKFIKLADFKGGWIVGNFNPSILVTEDVEIAVISVEAGHKGDGHYHKVSTEYNVIINGKAKLANKELGPGEIFVYEPYDKSEVEYLENTKLVVIRTPSSPKDKYY